MMKKYNLSKIMSEAWRLFKMNAKVVAQYQHSFSECLKLAWATAKREAKEAEALSQNEIGKRINGCLVWMRKVINVADTGRPGWSVSGKTYGCKAELRRMGFHWDNEAKAWSTTDQATAARFANC